MKKLFYSVATFLLLSFPVYAVEPVSIVEPQVSTPAVPPVVPMTTQEEIQPSPQAKPVVHKKHPAKKKAKATSKHKHKSKKAPPKKVVHKKTAPKKATHKKTA